MSSIRTRLSPGLGAPVAVTMVMVLLVGGWTVRVLAATEWNPTLPAGIAAREGPTLAYAEGLLGAERVDERAGMGHDGRFFFALANDPWLLEPLLHAAVLDRPVYRSQRILYPMLASLFGLLGPWATAWGMLVVSALSVAMGTYATALVAQGIGGSPWWGLAFGLNLGVISEAFVGGGGHLGLALLMAAIAAIQRNRLGWSVVLLSASVLTREVLLVSVVGISLWIWNHHGLRSALANALPAASIALVWALYVRSRVGWMTGVSQVEEIGWPFQGVWAAVQAWPSRSINFAAGVAMLGVLAAFTVRFLRQPTNLLGLMAIGFVPLASLLTFQVWFSYFDITRAVAPVITAFILLAFADGRRIVAEAPA